MSVCTKNCDGCDYRGSVSSGGSGARRTCDYILITGHRRGCPAGSKCTRRSIGGLTVSRMGQSIADSVRAADRARTLKKPENAKYNGRATEDEKLRRWMTLTDDELQALIWHSRRRWMEARDAKIRKSDRDTDRQNEP